jgi:hypothetical protein
MYVRKVVGLPICYTFADKENNMKILANLLLATGFVAVVSCTNTQKEAATDGTLTENTNQVLYNEAIDIHDEVMPEMGSLMGLKRSLQDTLATPALTAEQKQDFEARVKLLDSAHNSMMVWMRGFEPPKDTTDDPEYRQYIEQKLEDAKKMKALILEALEKGKL